MSVSLEASNQTDFEDYESIQTEDLQEQEMGKENNQKQQNFDYYFDCNYFSIYSNTFCKHCISLVRIC